METKSFVAYYRVSTQKQDVSGLGLDAQKSSVTAYTKDGVILESFTEIESGKKSNRLELTKAIAFAKQNNATLIVAKLDQLIRNVAFTSALLESGIEFVCVDMPDVNNLTIPIIATIAQNERGTISKRTKYALAEAKKYETVLGNPNAAKLMKEIHHKGITTIKENEKNNEYTVNALGYAQNLRKEGLSTRKIAKKLNESNMFTPRGKEFSATAVCRLLGK